jgi:hypothetical protein
MTRGDLPPLGNAGELNVRGRPSDVRGDTADVRGDEANVRGLRTEPRGDNAADDVRGETVVDDRNFRIARSLPISDSSASFSAGVKGSGMDCAWPSEASSAARRRGDVKLKSIFGIGRLMLDREAVPDNEALLFFFFKSNEATATFSALGSSFFSSITLAGSGGLLARRITFWPPSSDNRGTSIC